MWFATAALVAFGGGTAFAQSTWTWNALGSGSGPSDGVGTWSTSNSNWWTGSGTAAWNNAASPLNIAAFGTPTGTGTTVTVSGSVGTSGLIFNTLSVSGTTAPGARYTLTGGTIGIGTGNKILVAGTSASTSNTFGPGAPLINSTLVGSNLTLDRITGATGTPGINLTGTNNNLTGTLTVTGSLEFNATPSAIANVTLDLKNGTIWQMNTGTYTNNIVLNSNTNLQPRQGSPTLTGTITLAADGGITANSSQTITITKGIVESGGARSLFLGNRGTTVLLGQSTYTGTTTLGLVGGLDASVILDGGNDRLPTSTVVQMNATTTQNGLVLGGTYSGSSAASNQTIAGLISSATNVFVRGGATGTSTLTVNLASGTNTFAGILGGTAANANNVALTKSGSGTLSLTGTNTYTGPTTINAGTLSIGGAGVLGGGAYGQQISMVGTSAALVVSSSANQTLSGAISGSGSLVKSSVGTLLLSGSNSYSGATTISGGILQVGVATSALGSNSAVTVGAGSTLRLAGFNTTAGSLAGAGGTVENANASAASFTVGGDNTTTTFSGTLADGAGGGGLALVKNGSGGLTLSSSNSFTGGVTLNSGTLTIGSFNALGSGTLTTNGGTLNSSSLGVGSVTNPIAVNGPLTIAYGYPNTYSGALSGSADVSFVGTNALFLSQNVASYSGTIILNASSSADAVRLASGGPNWQNQKIDLRGNTVATREGLNGTQQLGAVSGSAGTTLRTGNGTVTFDVGYANTNAVFAGTITNNGTSTATSIQKSGSGTWTLSGSNSYTGTTTAANGVLRLDSAFALPGGIGASSGSSGLTINGGMVGLGNGDFLRPLGTGSSAVQWTGAGGFAAYTADRAVNLGGSSATVTWASGNFVPNGSALVLGATTADRTITLQNPIDLNGAVRTVQVDDGTAAVDASLGGAVAGSSGGLTKTGAGTLRLAVANSFGGTTTVSAGTLLLSDANALQNSTLATGGVAFDSAVGGNAFTLGGLSGSGAISLLNNAGSPAAIALTVGGNGGSTSFSGLLSGAGSLTKAGAGNLTLSSSNSFTGGVTLSSGTITLGNARALGTGTTTLAGGRLNLANLVVANTLNVTGSTQIGFSGNNLSSAAPVIGSGTLTITSADASPGAILLGSFDSFSGQVNVTAGEFRPATQMTNARVNLVGTSTSSLAAYLQDGYVGNAAIGELSGNQFSALRGGNGAVTYVVGGLNTSTEFAGSIVTTSATTSFTKVGTGVFTLSGSNGYTGATLISGGRLDIGSTGRINSTSGITINGGDFKYNSATTLSSGITFSGSGGTLSGTGTIGSSVAVGTNAILSPGNSPGTQAFSAGLAFNPGGTYVWELNALTGTAGTNWDLLNVTGGVLDLSGLSSASRFNLDLTTLTAGNIPGPLASEYIQGSTYQFLIASFAGATGFSTAAGTDLTNLFTLNLANWQGAKPSVSDMSVKVNSAGTGLELIIVPEPGAIGLAGIGAAMAGWTAWRQRQRDRMTAVAR
ncbi:MAG: autotransporter-associated beta strand repeat-containing protein [Planctomycetia bacterium]